jgi:hypothetical protein
VRRRSEAQIVDAIVQIKSDGRPCSDLRCPDLHPVDRFRRAVGRKYVNVPMLRPNDPTGLYAFHRLVKPQFEFPDRLAK